MNIPSKLDLMFHMKLHRVLFYIYLFLIPIQTRILYFPDKAYVSWYFHYNLAFFVYLSDLVLFLCFTCWILFDRPDLAQFTQKWLLLLLLGFFAVILIGLFHVKHIGLGIYQSIKWIELLCLLLYIMWNFRSQADFLSSATVFYISAVFQAIIGWFQFHVQHMLGLGLLGEYISSVGTPGLATIDIVGGKLIRAYGTFSHPNVLGAFLVLGIVCGLILVSCETLSKNRTTIKLATSIGLFVLFLGLFTTFSRVAWLTGGLSAIIFLIYYLREKKQNEVWLILIPLIVSCATVGLVYRTDLKSRVVEANQTSINDRYFFNDLGLKLIEKHPVLGVGVGNYVPTLLDTKQLEPWQYQPAHNIFIFLAAELGLAGLVVFLWILWEIFSKIPGRGVVVFGLTVIGILFIGMGQIDHYFVTIQQGRLMFFTVLGFLAATRNLNTYEKTN